MRRATCPVSCSLGSSWFIDEEARTRTTATMRSSTRPLFRAAEAAGTGKSPRPDIGALQVCGELGVKDRAFQFPILERQLCAELNDPGATPRGNLPGIWIGR